MHGAEYLCGLMQRSAGFSTRQSSFPKYSGGKINQEEEEEEEEEEKEEEEREEEEEERR